jgi:hypothetical protein
MDAENDRKLDKMQVKFSLDSFFIPDLQMFSYLASKNVFTILVDNRVTRAESGYGGCVLMQLFHTVLHPRIPSTITYLSLFASSVKL